MTTPRTDEQQSGGSLLTLHRNNWLEWAETTRRVPGTSSALVSPDSLFEGHAIDANAFVTSRPFNRLARERLCAEESLASELLRGSYATLSPLRAIAHTYYATLGALRPLGRRSAK